jgi:hypothetical protein
MPVCSRTRYAWRLRYDNPKTAARVQQAVLHAMKVWQTRWPDRYGEGTVEGAAFGILDVTLVCMSTHDQFYAHRWAQKFACYLARKAQVSLEEVRDPDPSLVHENMGRRRPDSVSAPVE